MADTVGTIKCENATGDEYVITITKDENNALKITFTVQAKGSEKPGKPTEINSTGCSRAETHSNEEKTDKTEIKGTVVGTDDKVPFTIICPTDEKKSPTIIIGGVPRTAITLPPGKKGHDMQTKANAEVKKLGLPK